MYVYITGKITNYYNYNSILPISEQGTLQKLLSSHPYSSRHIQDTQIIALLLCTQCHPSNLTIEAWATFAKYIVQHNT